MKLTILFVMVGLLNASAKGVSQNVTFSGENVPLKSVFLSVERQTGFLFLYPESLVKSSAGISLKVQNMTVDQVLARIFRNRPFGYTIKGKSVFIFPKVSYFSSPQTILPPKDTLIRIDGKVTNEHNEPLPGASIKVKGSNLGVSTDANGNFSVLLPRGGGVLIISFIGYETEEYPVAKTGKIAVGLKQSESKIDDVVVIGYGVKKKLSLTGSVVDVDTKTFPDLPVANPYQALQGRTPGLRITQSSGQPGSEGISLNIRGPNSFSSSNSPLVIIDGIVGDLSDIDPSFIQTVTVLKDASSAAIYGARAANGVILVTTKKGTGSSKLKVEYTGKYIGQSKNMWPERIWNSVDYMEMLNQAIENAGGGNGQIPYPDSIINKYKTPSDLYPNNNYEDFMIKNIDINTHSLSFSGKTGNTTYQAGFTTWNQGGIVRGFDYKKNTAMFNMDSRLNDKLKFGITLNGVIDQRKETANGASDMMLAILAQMPTYKPFVADGSGKYTFRAWADGNLEYPQKTPIGFAENGGTWTNGTRLQSTAYVEYQIIKGLTWLTKGGIRYGLTDGKTQMPLIPVYNYFTSKFEQYADNRGTIDLNQEMYKSMYQTIYSTLNYNFKIGQQHSFEVLGGVSQEKLKNENIGGSRRGFASPLLDVLSAGPTLGQTVYAGLEEYRLRSYFGRLNYNYKEKYLLEAVVRADGSSRFFKGSNYGTFPSLSAGWRLSEESFFKEAFPIITNLKVRASYGELGNDAIGNYPYQSTLNLGSNYYFENFYPGVSRSALANKQVKWEDTKESNLGVDFDLKSGLLYGSIDLFSKRTEGILRVSQLPGYAGLGAPYVNEGIVDNKGYELVLGHRGVINGFRYSADFNLSHYSNKLVKFGAPVIGTYLMKEGVEMNRYFMYQADGIYQTQAEIDKGPTPRWPSAPGDVRIKDVNGDGEITPDDRIQVDGVTPDFNFGLSLSGTYKGFDINILFQGESGRKTLVNSWVLPFSGRTSPLKYWQEGAWTPGSGINDKPRIIHGDGPLGQSDREVSTFWLKSVSFARLKFLTLGYVLPESLLAKYGIEKLRLFASGENLFTITGFEFGDPEGGNGWAYPSLKTISIGVNVQF